MDFSHSTPAPMMVVRSSSEPAGRPLKQEKRSLISRRHSDLSLPQTTSATPARRWSSSSSSSWFEADSPRSRSIRRNRQDGNKQLKQMLFFHVLPCLFLALVPWAPVLHYRRIVQLRSKRVLDIVRDHASLVHQLDAKMDSIRVLTRDAGTLEAANGRLYKQLRKQHGEKGIHDITESAAYDAVEQGEELLLEHVDKLEGYLQEKSRKRLSENYGSGPYRVEVTVDEPNRDESTSFIIQLALPTEMPYATDHFMKMVEEQLWDGLSFTHGTDSDVVVSSMMLSPHAPMVTAMSPRVLAEARAASRVWAMHRFEQANVTHMAFTEQSETFPQPHQHKYSVAFSGRPGGPGFYISLEDELKAGHERESTFGLVVSGHDVLDRFYLAKPTRDAQIDEKQRAIMGIVSMRFIEDEVAEGDDEDDE